MGSVVPTDGDLDVGEMGLARTEGPGLAPRKSRAGYRSRARGENNERGGAEGGFCAVLGHTYSEICIISEKSRIFDLDLTPKQGGKTQIKVTGCFD